MSKRTKLRLYEGESITVVYDAKRCIHAAECVHGLPDVFDPEARPWVQPDGASADEVANVVMRCPTGALSFERSDGGPSEPIPTENVILIAPDGPLYIRGNIELSVNGEPVSQQRVALCRCGASQNKPFCDNSHQKIDFEADGLIVDNRDEVPKAETGEVLTVILAANGPYLLQGDFEVHSEDRRSIYRGQKAAMCRCGASSNKPFCDGSHTRIGFSDD